MLYTLYTLYTLHTRDTYLRANILYENRNINLILRVLGQAPGMLLLLRDRLQLSTFLPSLQNVDSVLPPPPPLKSTIQNI